MFTSKEKIKKRIGLETAGFDNLIDSLIASVTGHINRLCSTTLEADDYIERYTPVRTIILRHAPINTLTEVKIVSSNTVLTEDEDYFVDYRTGMIEFYALDTLLGTPKDIQVTYNAGYTIEYDEYGESTENDTLPAEIRELAETMVIRKFKKRESEGRDSESFNGSSVTWSKVIDKDEKLMLRAFSRVRHSH